jgi:hypothetical protein
MLTLLAVPASWHAAAQSPPTIELPPSPEERQLATKVLHARRTHLARSLGFCQERLQQLNETGDRLSDLSDRREALGFKPLRVEVRAYRLLGLATDIELKGSSNCLEAVSSELRSIDAALSSASALNKVAIQTRELRQQTKDYLRVNLGALLGRLQTATAHHDGQTAGDPPSRTDDVFSQWEKLWQHYEAWRQAGYVDDFAGPFFATARIVRADFDAWRAHQALAVDVRAMESNVARSRQRDASISDRASLPDTLRALADVRHRLEQAAAIHGSQHQQAERDLALAVHALQK